MFAGIVKVVPLFVHVVGEVGFVTVIFVTEGIVSVLAAVAEYAFVNSVVAGLSTNSPAADAADFRLR